MEITYYPFPVPINRYTITSLGLLFDKVYLPGLYFPPKLTKDNLKDILDRFERYPLNPDDLMFNEHRVMLACVKFFDEYSMLSDIFVATGKEGNMGMVEPETEALAKELEETIYGPPPEGFIPSISQGFNIDGINGPSWITYPANAYLWGIKNQKPLFSDRQDFPFPENIQHNSNAEYMASYLMISSLALTLPRIKPLSQREILDAKLKLRDDILKLRDAMNSLLIKYRQLVGENPSVDKFQKEANFLAQAQVKPALDDLVKRIETPGEIIKSEMVDLTLEIPRLSLSFQANPSLDILMEFLKLGTKELKDGIERYIKSNKLIEDSGLSLLLKLPEKYKR